MTCMIVTHEMGSRARSPIRVFHRRRVLVEHAPPKSFLPIRRMHDEAVLDQIL